MKEKGNVAVWIIAMVAAGLIVSAIVSPQFREQIGDWLGNINLGNNYISVKTVRNNPNEYLGEKVTVRAHYYTGGLSDKRLGEAESLQGVMGYEFLPGATENVFLSQGTEYLFTGTVVESYATVSLKVSNVKPI